MGMTARPLSGRGASEEGCDSVMCHQTLLCARVRESPVTEEDMDKAAAFR